MDESSHEVAFPNGNAMQKVLRHLSYLRPSSMLREGSRTAALSSGRYAAQP